jgi:APA family basic amino acid/polyamine antiporter
MTTVQQPAGRVHRSAGPVLLRRIGFWSAVAILVGRTIGAGIFRSPASIADLVPSVFPALGIWVAGGVLALCGALSLAELAGTFPQTGGIFVFIREGWGKLPSFLYGWTELVITRATTLAAVSTVFAEYFLKAIGGGPKGGSHATWVHVAAASAIAVVGALNYRGVRWGVLLQNVTTLVKCGGLLALIVLAFLLGAPGSAEPVAQAGPEAFGIGQIALALIAVLWVYNGWADVGAVGGEVKDPERNLPRVLAVGTLIVIAFYILANVAYFKVLPLQELRHSPLVAADVASRLVGTAGVVGIGLVVMFSTLGTLNGSMLAGSRVLWAMAHDGLLFKRLANVHPRFETPNLAILVTTVLGVIFVSVRTFESLAATVVTASLPYYVLAVSAVFRMRRREGYRPAYRVIGYPITPILFIAASLYLLGAAFVKPATRLPTTIVFLVVLAGIPIYYAFVAKRLDTAKA